MDVSLLVQMGLDWLVANVPSAVLVLTALGALVVIGQAYILLTPGKGDDEWYAKIQEKPVVGKILKMLANFAPFQKKP